MRKVVVVEDSPTESKRLTEIFQRNGFEVYLAENGAAGVEMVRAVLPDIVVMDVVMPELNGFQATRKLSRDPLTEHIPVLMNTTKDQASDKVWGERNGASGYLVKPASEQQLLAEVNRFC